MALIMLRLLSGRWNEPHGERSAMPILYGLAILAVFVCTVAVIAVKAGTSSAIVTAVLTVTVGGTAFGLWGAAMAVREHAVGTSSQDDDPHSEIVESVEAGSKLV